jgi:hypothetical protein
MSGSGAATTLHSLLQFVQAVTRLVQSEVNNACMHVYIYIYMYSIPTPQSIPMTIVNLCADYSCTLHFSLNSSIFSYSFEHPALSLGSLHVWDSSMVFFVLYSLQKLWSGWNPWQKTSLELKGVIINHNIYTPIGAPI